jgi:4-amino-4-deoxy-L-arabinose transferase-like glycosyltransferase
MSARAVDSPVVPRRAREIGTSSYGWLLGLGAITLAGGAMRFVALGTQSFDEDESATVSLMHLPFWRMLHHIGPSESTPPLYYALAWPWTHAFGTSETAIRSLSALIGLMMIPAAYALGTTLAGRRAGMIAAALAAASPMLVWYSQEARAYALVALFSTVATVFFVRTLRKPSNANLAGWALTGSLALLSHYFAGFLLAGEGIYLLATAPRRRSVAAACAVPVATALALVPLVQAQRADPLKTSYIQLSSLGSRITGIPKQFLLGPNVALGRIAGVVLVVGFLGSAWLLSRRSPTEVRARTAALAAIAGAALIVPILLALLGSSTDFVVARNMLPVLVSLLAVAAAGFATTSAGLLTAVVVVLVGLAASIAVPLTPRLQRPNWRQAATTIGTIAVHPRAVLIAPAHRGVAPLFVYLKQAMIPPDLRPCVREVDLVGFAPEGQDRPLAFPSTAPVAGFRLVQRRVTASFTLLRFESATAAPLAAIRVPARVRIVLQDVGAGDLACAR